MRDLSNLADLFTRVEAKQKEPQSYRFHGQKSPADRKRVPVLAQVPGTSVDNGIATLRLYEPIDSWGGPWGISALEFLEALDQVGDVEQIDLHINSPGGEVWEALAILNNLRQHKAKVNAIVDGIAASSASFIAVAADTTVMAPNSQLMIHKPYGICLGEDTDMHTAGDMLAQVGENIASVYAVKAGGTPEEWLATMAGEAWYLAGQAVEAGLADSVLGEDAKPADKLTSFDMSGVGAKYPSADKAPEPPMPANRDDTSDRPVPPTKDQVRARMHERRERAGTSAA